MGTRRYNIELHLDASSAAASSKRAAAAVGGIGDAAQKAAERAARSAQKLADTQATIAMRAADRKVAIAERAADRELAIQQRAAGRAVQARESADARIARSQKKLWDDATIQAKVAQQRIANANEKRVEAAMKAAGVEYRGFKNGFEGADKLMGGIKGVAGAFGLATTAAGGIEMAVDLFDRASKSAMEAGKFVQSYRKDLLELAALKDRLGQSTPEVRENLAFRAATLMSKEDADRFQKTTLGAGESAIDKAGVEKKISAAEFSKLQRQAGAFAAAEGGDVEAHARVAGLMPMLMGKRTDADEAMANISKFYNISKPGGSDYSQFAEQYMKNSGYVTSGVVGKDEMAAVQSMFSVTNKDAAGEQTQQLIRATLGSVGKLKGVKVEGDSQKIGEYQKSLGITNQLSLSEHAEKIAADLARQEDAAKAKGEHFNALDYLTHKGYGNQEDRLALMAFAGNVNGSQEDRERLTKLGGGKASGAWGQTFKPLMNAPAVNDIGRKVAEFQAADPEAQGRKADLAEDIGNVAAGAGANEYALQLRRLAFGRLKARPDSGVTAKDYNELAAASSFNLVSGAQYAEVEREAMRMIRAEQVRVGIKKAVPGDDGSHDAYLGTGWEQDRSRKYFEAMQEVGAKGGNMLPGFDELLANGQAQLKALEAIEDAVRRGVPNPAPGRPGNRPAGVAPPPLPAPRPANGGGPGRP